MIDGILWLLQAPPPLVIVAVFVALTWYLQRRWKVCLLVLLGFLFILNQGYWEETTESLTLVLSSCVVCMGLGVPIGIAAAHRPRLYAAMRPGAGPDADPAHLRLPDPGHRLLRPRHGAGPDRHGDLRPARADPPDPSWRLLHPARRCWRRRPPLAPRRSQRLWKVELPYAFPQIMAGLNQTIMLSLSMVVIAALVGADGLGVPVRAGAELGQHRAGL